MGAAGISRVKVFGERNTGTNFAERLIALNHPGVRVLHHGSNDGLAAEAARFGPALAPLVLERLIDARRAAEFPHNFGWKHAAPSAAALRGAPAFAGTAFLFLVRNPFRFLVSLWRRPYNLVQPGGPVRDLSDFLRTPVLANQRDGLATGLIADPVELWSAKTRAHCATAAALGAQALLLRYEDLVERPDLATRWLAGLGQAAGGPVRVPALSTKGDRETFEDYREDARSYDPRRDFAAQDIALIGSRIDAGLCARLGYALNF